MFRRLVAPGALVGAALLVYWPVLLGASFGLRDFLVWTLPSRALVREALLEGRLALWQPYLGLGMPAVVEPVNGVFYPPHLLLAALPLVTGVNLLYLVHVIAGGAGAFVLAREAGAGRPGALAGGITFMLCGVTTSGWASGLGVLTGAWMPWCAAAAVRLGRSHGAGGVAPMALALGPTALAGDPFQFIRAGLLALPLALGAAWSSGRPVGRATVRLAVAAALGALLAAAAIVPGLASLDDSERSGGLSLREAGRWSLHPVRFVEMIAPGALGDPTAVDTWEGARWLSDDRLGPVPWCHSVYMGIGLVALAPLALRRSRRRSPLCAALLVAAGLGAALALGRHTPLFAAARAVVPGLEYFRYPEKFLDLCAVAVATLVALGVDGALHEPAAAARRVGLSAVALLLGAGVAFAAGAPASMPRALAIAASFGGSLALALALAARRDAPRAGAAAVVLLLTADLATAAAPLLRWIPAHAIEEPSLPLRRPAGAPPPRVYRDPGIDDAPAPDAEARARLHATTMRGNLAAVHGFAVVPGYESAHAARWHQLWDALAPRGGAALRLLGVDAVFAARPIPDADLERRSDGFPVWHAVRRRLPRAYLAALTRPRGADPAELLAPDVVDGRVALVEDPGARVDGPDHPAVPCTIARFSRERLEVACPPADRDAMLVVIEAWAPGWTATVDGVAAPVHRVNDLMRGVRLAAGARSIELVYRPRAVVLGGALSGIAAIAVAALIALGRRRARSEPAGARPPPPVATSPP